MSIEVLSNKLLRSHYHAGTNSGGHLMHFCPACNDLHEFAVDRPFQNGHRWSWDGNVDKPTFTPSMNIRVGPFPSVPEGRPDAGKIKVCHYFLQNGKIQYLSDCTHSLTGYVVDLPDIPEKILLGYGVRTNEDE